ncbi:dihydrodipicolinate synthase family protein (plasmid) [Paenibacillus rhizovicinus]|uniref:Dihydrodipicolinate synthase family protein n=1 Tax=Paenibacillus rhizovicinus TaxID=2704463 RepID=A0A6C0PAX9_9BACL|nr:dihydrodipicolinate synthase family protein [Paenibacillus rhizovicinus]QHW35525.1 dihydrodipicolinate synthase family protein [Paenibacillus rhizovicinus]
MALLGNIPVVPTPFLNGKIDQESIVRLIERTAPHLDGYVVCGSTGEAPALTTSERKDVIRAFAKESPKQLELVIGLGHTSLEDAIELGLDAAEAGIKSALVPSPYYFPNSLDMVIDYVGKLAEATGLDIVFYDNPVTTKTTFTADSLIRLSEAVSSIKAVKMTDHAFGKIRELKARTKLSVFGGDDIICFRAFEAGVDGNMIIAPIIFPEAFRECWNHYVNGDRERSFDIYSRTLLPFISMFGPGDEIPTTKALFKHLGLFSSAETRTPLLASDAQRTREVLLGYQQGLQKQQLK